jgi:hypothetical protein
MDISDEDWEPFVHRRSLPVYERLVRSLFESKLIEVAQDLDELISSAMTANVGQRASFAASTSDYLSRARAVMEEEPYSSCEFMFAERTNLNQRSATISALLNIE